jgi:radical SAM superfamily enzyme YgiQ (UPF0313 family)
MSRIVLTADPTQMSEYWGIPLLPFFSCAPAEKVPRPVFDFLSPSVPHNNGVAIKAPYGLRKLEAAMMRNYRPDEVTVAHPDHVSKFVDEKTSIIGISTMDPLGLGPVSMMFTDGGKLTAYSKRKFLELVGEINKTRKKFPKAKLVIGGSGAWQMEVRDRDTKALGVDHVVVGECDHVIQDIYNDIESNGAPEFIHVPRGPKLEQIPDILAPTTHGLVEVMRGCGRNCQFCEPNLRIAKYYPRDKIEREIGVNRKIGNPNVWVHSEDIFLYKLEDKRGFMPNHDAVVDLFDNVMSQKGITYANPTHGTTAPAWADPELIRDISETVRKGTKRHIGIQSGLETGSSELIKKYMPLKVKPFSPDEWQDVIYNGTRIFNEYYWFPAYTIIVGLPGETTEDAVETVRLIDRMEHGLRKEVGDKAHFTVTPLSFVPLGVLKKSGFYNIDDQIDEARFWVIYRSWRHTVLELHTMPPTLIQLNPVLKGVFTTLCWFGSKKILDGIKAWGRTRGFDADKSLRLN